MNTKTKTCIVRFVGGPSDGLVLSDSRFSPQDKVQMPAGPALVQCGHQLCRELVGHWSTAYSLTSRGRAVEHGQRTMYLRYDFVGYELLEMPTERASAQQDGPRRVAVRTWFSKLGRKFVDWMLEPVNHPLMVPVEQVKPMQ